MSDLQNLRWPAIRITEPDGIAIVVHESDELLTARYIGIPDLDRLDSILVVDTDGMQYALSCPQVAGRKPNFLKKLAYRISNPRVRVEYRCVEFEGKIDLPSLKKRLTENVHRYPEYWMERDFESPEALSQLIDASPTVADVIQLIDEA